METVYGKRETYRITKFLDKGESFFVLGYGDIDGHEGGWVDVVVLSRFSQENSFWNLKNFRECWLRQDSDPGRNRHDERLVRYLDAFPSTLDVD